TPAAQAADEQILVPVPLLRDMIWLLDAYSQLLNLRDGGSREDLFLPPALRRLRAAGPATPWQNLLRHRTAADAVLQDAARNAPGVIQFAYDPGAGAPRGLVVGVV